jgi:FkbM family methyltransferase
MGGFNGVIRQWVARGGFRRRFARPSGAPNLVDELARQIDGSPDDGAALISQLADRLHVKSTAQLAESLTPTRELDYPRHPIRLVVSSPAIKRRLDSVAKEPFTVDWLETFQPGDVFYDVGANVGPYSLIAAKATGGSAQVLALEPSPASFAALARNVEINDCAGCVTPLPLALWSETGLVPVTWRSGQAGRARHRLDTETDSAAMVVGIRLDDFVEQLGGPVPTHAKVDVDGHELDVLRGAERTLARPEWRSIMVELDREESPRNEEIRSLLSETGFGSGTRIERTPTRRYPHPERRPDVYWNFTRRAA